MTKTRIGKKDIFANTTRAEKKAPVRPKVAATYTSEENKLTVILPPDQVAFLDGLALDIRAKTKAKVRRTEIIRALVGALKDSKVDLTACGSENEMRVVVIKKLS